MASEPAPVSAPTAPLFLPTLSEPATVTTTPIDSDLTRTKSLKRSRQPDLPVKSVQFPGVVNNRLSPSPKSPRYRGEFAPAILTGAAALEDQRRKQEELAKSAAGAISENPGHRAIASLMAGGGQAISKPHDAPTATSAMSEGMSIAANALTIPTETHENDKSNTSPASVTSLANLGSTAQTVTASPTIVASPAAMTGLSDSESRGADNQSAKSTNSKSLKTPAEEQSNRALSFPGNMITQGDGMRAPQRGLSLPMPGQNQQLAPRSPSQKKHKCPYCETEFTRHHNLKSHLLTHSQEKPYVCQTCNMRFRRLHDLKRHSKLHTGERPHVCPKCDRKFARGDALARHSKGQGGCAGRRASMGSFGGEDDYQGSNGGEDDDMEGVSYSNGNQHGNEANMTEEERRRASVPSISAQHVGSHHGSQDSYSAHARTPSTYPPAGPRPSGQPAGGLFPPSSDRGSSSSGTSPSMPNSYPGQVSGGSLSSTAFNTGGNSTYAQMTESPKPLSPAGMHSHQLGHDPGNINRQRSPSLTTQFQQQHFGRRPTGRDSPTGITLPSPLDRSQGPKLPAISGLAPPEGRFTLSSQTSTQQNPNANQQGQSTSSSPNSMFQPPRSAGPSHHGSGSGDSSKNLFAAGEQGVWAYVQTLEEQVKDLTAKLTNSHDNERAAQEQIMRQAQQINTLNDDVNYLRSQLGAMSQNQQPPMSEKA
ncbi:hypothetical protein B0O99DRAFT_519828 [Bisporella sp. PMI_857]|nr:hypothetical protein B0O99DRAFT_519828 [Bisporella sp. PMI_857]